jgi:hypothetical protein
VICEPREAILEKLRASTKPIAPQEIGSIGREFQPDWPDYAQKADLVTTQSGAQIPYMVMGCCDEYAQREYVERVVFGCANMISAMLVKPTKLIARRAIHTRSRKGDARIELFRNAQKKVSVAYLFVQIF